MNRACYAEYSSKLPIPAGLGQRRRFKFALKLHKVKIPRVLNIILKNPDTFNLHHILRAFPEYSGLSEVKHC